MFFLPYGPISVFPEHVRNHPVTDYSLPAVLAEENHALRARNRELEAEVVRLTALLNTRQQHEPQENK